MTPNSALAVVRNQINETTANANFWTDAEIYDYMTDAETQLAGIVGFTQAVTAHTTVTDQSVYTVPDNCVKIARLTFDGKKLKKVDDRDIDYLDGTDAGSTIESGEPDVYKEWGDNVTLYPTPDDSYGEKTLYFEFYQSPTAIATASTKFTITQPVINNMIADYAIYRCYLKATETKLANEYLTRWNSSVAAAHSMKWNEENWDRIQVVKDEDFYNSTSLGMC